MVDRAQCRAFGHGIAMPAADIRTDAEIVAGTAQHHHAGIAVGNVAHRCVEIDAHPHGDAVAPVGAVERDQRDRAAPLDQDDGACRRGHCGSAQTGARFSNSALPPSRASGPVNIARTSGSANISRFDASMPRS